MPSSVPRSNRLATNATTIRPNIERYERAHEQNCNVSIDFPHACDLRVRGDDRKDYDSSNRSLAHPFARRAAHWTFYCSIANARRHSLAYSGRPASAGWRNFYSLRLAAGYRGQHPDRAGGNEYQQIPRRRSFRRDWQAAEVAEHRLAGARSGFCPRPRTYDFG